MTFLCCENRFETGRFWTLRFSLILMVLLRSLCSQSTVSISDSIFSNANWTTSKKITGTGINFGASDFQGQSAGLGNPASSFEMTIQTTAAAPTTAWTVDVMSIYTGGGFNPSSLGSIRSISYGEDRIATVSVQGGAPALIQNGAIYYFNPSYAVISNGSWSSFSVSSGMENASNWTRISTTGSLNPDFSTNGSLINFGVYRANSGGVGTLVATRSYFDNWSVSINYSFSTSLPTTTSILNYASNSSTNQALLIDGSTPGSGLNRHSQINSTGVVSLGGGILKPQTVFFGSSGFVPVYGQSFTLFNGSAITGSFGAIDNSGNPSALKFIVEYQDRSLNVYATPGDYGQDVVNLNANQNQVGKALQTFRVSSVDNRSGVTLGPKEKIFNALMRMSAPQLQNAFQELDPAAFQTQQQVSFSTSQFIHTGFQSRIDQIMSGTSGGVNFNGLSLTNLYGEPDYEPLADIGLPYIKKRVKSEFNYFIRADGNWGDIEQNTQKYGYDFYNVGSQLGVDKQWSSGLTTGLLLWQGSGKTVLNSINSVMKNHRGGGGIYVHQNWKGFYAGFYGGAGKHFYETERSISFLNEKSLGETEGVALQGSGEMGYECRLKNWGFGPSFSLAYDRTWIDPFYERGSAASLQVSSQDIVSLRHWLGLRMHSAWKAGKIVWVPNFRIGWGHEYFGKSEIRAKFQAGGDWFNVETTPLDRDTLQTQVGLTLQFSGDWSVSTTYLAQLLAATHTYNALEVGVRWGF